MYVSQPMHSHTSIFLAQWADECSGHVGREEGYSQPQKYGFPFPKVDLATGTAGHLACQKQKSLLNPLYIRYLPTWNGQHFILAGSVSANTASKYKDPLSV